MRLPNICGLLTASALLFGANSANALVLTIDDLNDGVAATVIDDALDAQPFNGRVGYDSDSTGSIGDFNVVISNGFGFPSASRTGPRFASTDLSVQTEGFVSGTLEITLTDEGRMISTPASANNVVVNSILDFGEVTNAAVTTTTFIKTDPLGSFVELDTTTALLGDIDEAIRKTVVSGELFDLKTVIVVEHILNKIQISAGLAAFANADGNLKVSAVPLPAALPLFLTALLGLGFVGRQRRRQTA